METKPRGAWTSVSVSIRFFFLSIILRYIHSAWKISVTFSKCFWKMLTLPKSSTDPETVWIVFTKKMLILTFWCKENLSKWTCWYSVLPITSTFTSNHKITSLLSVPSSADTRKRAQQWKRRHQQWRRSHRMEEQVLQLNDCLTRTKAHTHLHSLSLSNSLPVSLSISYSLPLSLFFSNC